MKKIHLVFALVLACSFCSFAQEDAEGCKDHPMFNRLPNFLISNCSQNYASLDVVTGNDKKEAQEGTLTHLDYSFNSASGGKKPSWLQIVKNYENSILKLGGKKIYGSGENASYKINTEGKEIWVMLTLNSGEELQVDQMYLDILEKEEMKQEISANDIYSALNTTGSIALYINFETGKSDIKQESQSIIDQVANMLKENSGLKISIEGHTDNVGTAAANKTLSENRAKSVMNALAAKGIEKSRLTAKGWGQEKPLIPNTSDEGKAKNRRVEIVKL